jgi:hypothetical protein
MKTDLTTFRSWCDAKGISTPLTLEQSGNYRRMCLPSNKEDLMTQSTQDGLINVVQVPLDACIVGEDLPTLVEKLKYEKKLGDKSDFAPWLDLFPTLQDFQDMPRFWSPERLDFVKQYDGGQLDARMEMDKTRMTKTDDDWALACVDSRSNFLPDDTYSITPMLDMFNHDSSYKTSARVDGGDRLILEVSEGSIFGLAASAGNDKSKDWKDNLFGMFSGGGNDNSYRPGAEVFVSYGSFDNVETLANYGFVSDSPNVCNIEQFKVRSLTMGPGGPAILIVDNEGSIDNLFNTMSLDALRLSLATPEELESYKKKKSNIISEPNEEEMYALIAGELEEAVYDAKAGAAEAETKKDALVARYLKERHRTLSSGLAWLKKKYPQVF